MTTLDHLQQPLRRVREELDALRRADTWEKAFDAWTGFVGEWSRAKNKIDATGKRSKGTAWARLDPEVHSDPLLNYLRAARNADEHGLADIATQMDGLPALSLTTVGSIHVQGIRLEGRRIHVDFTPNSPGSHPLISIEVRNIKLEAVNDGRAGAVAVPTQWRTINLQLAGPVQIAECGLAWLEEAMTRL